MIAPARKPDNEIALIQTPAGFGTPPFDHDGRRLQVRVEAAEVVVEEDGSARRAPIVSIAEAAALRRRRPVRGGTCRTIRPSSASIPGAAAALAEFYAFAARVLEAARSVMSPADEATPIYLWPEHFDIAFEAGPESLGRRANYGASPGDGDHSQPYIYVGPWRPQTAGGLWNATGFAGAELGYAELACGRGPRGPRGRVLHRPPGGAQRLTGWVDPLPAGILAACDSACSPGAATVPA